MSSARCQLPCAAESRELRQIPVRSDDRGHSSGRQRVAPVPAGGPECGRGDKQRKGPFGQEAKTADDAESQRPSWVGEVARAEKCPDRESDKGGEPVLKQRLAGDPQHERKEVHEDAGEGCGCGIDDGSGDSISREAEQDNGGNVGELGAVDGCAEKRVEERGDGVVQRRIVSGNARK